MLILNCFIFIKSPDRKREVTFNYVTQIEVVTSTQNFTDTAKITVPRKLKYKGKSITEFIKRNDSVSISLGYGKEFSFETVFTGYIKSVSTGTPIVIECENEAWKLKQIKVPANYYPKLQINDFVVEWMKGYVCKIAEVELGEVRINEETTLGRVFEYFMQNYPVKFYFKGGVFYGVLPGAMAVQNSDVKTIKFKIGENTISDNLTYTLEEDVKLVIVAKCITRDNKKLEYKTSANTDGADVQTFLVPGAQTEKELKAYAQDKLKTSKIDKMTGDFICFGEPFVRKGDLVYLLDEDNKERHDKKFIADAVTYTFGQGGYRQKITLGAQIHA